MAVTSAENGQVIMQHDSSAKDSLLTAKERKASENNNSCVQTASTWQIMVNLINCCFGVGIFSLPWSTAGSSIVVSVLVVLGVVVVNAWTCMIVIKAGDKYKTFDLGSVLLHLPGNASGSVQAVCNIAIWVTIYLCLIAYIIVMVDALTPFLAGTVYGSRPVLVAFFCVLMLPLCFLEQRYLSFTSTLSICVTTGIFAIMIKDLVEGRRFISELDDGGAALAPPCALGFSPGAIAMFSAMMQAVVIQMCVLPMYEELKDRSVAKFEKINFFGFTFVFIFFALFAVVGYVAYGDTVPSNVIQSLPHSVDGQVARVAAIVCTAAVFPIMAQAMVAPVKHSEFLLKHGISIKQGNAAALVLSIALVFPAGLYMSDLGIINTVNGAISCFAFVALCSSLIGMYLVSGQWVTGRLWQAAMIGLLLLGTVASFLGFIDTDNYAAELATNCLWLYD